MPAITSTANASVKEARKLARRRRRSESGLLLVEGPAVLAAARGHLERVFVAVDADPEARAQAHLAAEAGADVLEVTGDVLRTLSETVAPRGAIGVARLDEPESGRMLDGAALALLCCDVADPGNVGTIIRTADAAGAAAVLLSPGSVDARNPKAVRASAGSLFHLPVASDVGPDVAMAAARRAGLRVIAADAAGGVSHTAADLAAPAMLVLGGEAHGLPSAVLAACDEIVRVDMHAAERPGYGGRAESLNLAATAAIVAFEAVRQRSAAAGGAA